MMRDSSLEEHILKSNESFDGLLSLIPAKLYYGEDTSVQWQRKKQTKAEAAAARRNKLDPDSALNRSVKEVMDEQAKKKRKRDEAGDSEDDDWSEVEGVEHEKPRQGLKAKASDKSKKKQKKADKEAAEVSEREERKEEKKAARKERKADRQRLRDEEAEFQRRTIKGVNKVKLGIRPAKTDSSATSTDASPPGPERATQPGKPTQKDKDGQDSEGERISDRLGAGKAADADDDEEPSSELPSPPLSHPPSPVFDPNGTPAGSTGQAPSTTTSVSSTSAPSERSKPIKVPADTTALRARLAARIQALRDARKADSKSIRTRQELIESRRQKQAERKAHKKELRQKAKSEEDRKRDEALASARNSPRSMLSPNVDLDDLDNNFSFGRIGFGDGSQLSHDLTHTLTNGKKKGPSDAKTALQRLENQKKRIQAMDEEKRKDVEGKEVWLTARKRAAGEKVKDDEKLLKKAVKRKEHDKKKSEKDWTARKEGVAKSMRDRQKKREENIRKRRDDRALGKGGKKKGGPKKSSKPRAGFEGSFMGSKR